MTAAKPNHLAARRLLLDHLDIHPGTTVGTDLDPAEVGVVGDTAHAEGGDSYHLGKDQIRKSGHRYSVDESARDARGLDNYASAMDVGAFKVTTGRGTFDLPYYSRWLVALCKAGDPDTADLREVIYSPDGKTVHRWDREGRRSSGDNSHLFHTHHSEYRNADGHRMLRLTTRWLQHIGLIPEEDDEVTKTEFIAWLKDPAVRAALATGVWSTDNVIAAPGNPKPGKNPDGTDVNTHWGADSFLRNIYTAAVSGRDYAAQARTSIAALAGKDVTDEPAIIAGVLAGLSPELIAAAIPAELAAQVVTAIGTRLSGTGQ